MYKKHTKKKLRIKSIHRLRTNFQAETWTVLQRFSVIVWIWTLPNIELILNYNVKSVWIEDFWSQYHLIFESNGIKMRVCFSKLKKYFTNRNVYLHGDKWIDQKFLGERACYNSISARGDQLLLLGTKAAHVVKLRSWPERIMYLSDKGRWAEALNLAAEEGTNKERFATYLLLRYFESLNQNIVDKESLVAAVKCCVKLNKV